MQKFRYLVILDFEATCELNKKWRNEIIEFPSVLLDTTTLTRLSEFHQYVKPKRNPQLTPFCTELTGIQQEWVDNAKPIEEVLIDYDRWLNENALFDSKLPERPTTLSKSQKKLRHLYQTSEKSELFAFVTCGDWDLQQMLVNQAKDDNLQLKGYFSGWINVKKIFAKEIEGNLEKLYGMAGMLDRLNIPLQGRHHSGIDDCRNITTIVEHLLKRGAIFDETSMRWI